jgi:hypothetical protein
MYLCIDVLPPTMFFLESSSGFLWERLNHETVEFSLVWMTPALLGAYLVLRWQKNRQKLSGRQLFVWEPAR